MRLSSDENQRISISSRNNRNLPWLMLLLLPLTAGLAACNSETVAREEDTARPVKVAVLEPGSSERTLSYSGVVRPRIESVIGFRVPGKVVERLANVGDRLVVGDAIARLDDTDLKLAENSARAAVGSARTRRDVAIANLDRAKPLLPQGFISKAVYDVRKNEVDAAVAALDTAEAQLRQAANAVGYAVLVADKPGIVTAVSAEPGQVLSTGQAVITLAVSGETEIMIAVPEQDTGHLSVGQQAKVSLWSGPRENIAGRIREIAGQADAASRTYAVRVAVSAPPQMMRLGMTATVKFSVSEGTTAMVVPLAAVTEIGGSRVVFVVDRASKVVHATPITVSGVAADGVRIVSGLEAGDIVVSAGVQFLRDGMRVRLAAAPNS